MLVAICVSAGFRATAAAPPPAGNDEADDYRVVNWTTADGLPQSTVNEIVRAPEGGVWLATFGGLVRFDGSRFSTYDIATDTGLPSNRITALARTGDGELWFVTQPGHLGVFRDGHARTLTLPRRQSADFVALAASGSTIYTQTSDGSVWASHGGSEWQPVLPESATGWGSLNSMAAESDGQAWCTWGPNLVHLTNGRASGSIPLPAPGVSVARRADGGVWVGLREGGVAAVHDERVEVLDVRPAPGHSVSAVLGEAADTVWIAAAEHVFRLERQAAGWWSSRQLPFELPPGTRVRALWLEDDGTLWIGTGGRGLFRVSRLPIRRFGPAVGITAVVAAATDGLGGAWVSSSCAGLRHVDAHGTTTFRPVPPSEGQPADCDHALAFDARGPYLWLRARDALYRVGAGRDDMWRVPVGLTLQPGSLALGPGGSLWIVSRDGHLQRIDAAGRELERLDVPSAVYCVVTGADGTLWLGGERSVFHVTGDRIEALGAQDGVPPGPVRDILPEADGTLWIATYGGGLARLKDGRATRFTDATVLPDNSLSRILDDGHGRLWVATNRGIAVLERAALEAPSDTLAPAVVLGLARGVPEANYGAPAGFVDADGVLWFGTIEGLVRVDSRRFPFNARPPAVRIEHVYADDRDLGNARELMIPPGTERVRLTFAVGGILESDGARSRFRIEGVDRGWVDIGRQRSASWTPAGPGTHRVLIEARNEDGVWSAAPAIVQLEVLPAWHQTRTARVLGALVLLATGLALYRARVRVIERRHLERLRTLDDQRRMEEEAASLRAQLERVSRVALAGELATSLAHEVNQPLGAIVNNAETGRRLLPTDDREELGAILSDIIADGLRASEVIRGLRGFLQAGTTAPTRIDLSALVEEVLPLLRREFRDNEVRLTLALSRTLPPVSGIRVKLQQVLVNLLLNACEALSARPTSREIRVTTAERDGTVEVLVQDNGPGLAAEVAGREFDPLVTTKTHGLGMGLAISRSIADAHGGSLRAESPPEGGLRIVLSLPAADRKAGTGGAPPADPLS